MKVIKDLSGDTIDGISYTLNIENFQEFSSKEVLMYGINSTINPIFKKEFESYERKVLLNLWSPCEYASKNNLLNKNGYEQTDYFTEIYSVCPFTNQWLKTSYNDDRFKYIFHPHNTLNIPNIEKIYDVCYFGGIHGPHHQECINTIKNFNYRFMSQSSYPGITNYNVSYIEKMKIVSQCKISVCFHFVPLRDEHVQNIKNYKKWENNQAFSHLNNKIMPQFKARMHEAAICKTINLVQKDPWNVVEDFYTPDKDFIYFNNSKELASLIKEILNNYETYHEIIENAYEKSLLYGQKETYQIIKNKDEITKCSKMPLY